MKEINFTTIVKDIELKVKVVYSNYNKTTLKYEYIDYYVTRDNEVYDLSCIVDDSYNLEELFEYLECLLNG